MQAVRGPLGDSRAVPVQHIFCPSAAHKALREGCTFYMGSAGRSIYVWEYCFCKRGRRQPACTLPPKKNTPALVVQVDSWMGQKAERDWSYPRKRRKIRL